MGLGAGLAQCAIPSHTPGKSDLVCLGLILQPVTSPPPTVYMHLHSLCIFILSHPFYGEWWQVTAATMFGWWLWMCARHSLWILLSMAGVPAVPRGQHPYA
jgi:hypothetical protein